MPTSPRRSCKTLRRSLTSFARISVTSTPEHITGSGRRLSRYSARCCGDIPLRIVRGSWGSFCSKKCLAWTAASTDYAVILRLIINLQRYHILSMYSLLFYNLCGSIGYCKNLRFWYIITIVRRLYVAYERVSKQRSQGFNATLAFPFLALVYTRFSQYMQCWWSE